MWGLLIVAILVILVTIFRRVIVTLINKFFERVLVTLVINYGKTMINVCYTRFSNFVGERSDPINTDTEPINTD